MEPPPPPRGFCSRCGYSLHGLTPAPTGGYRCPECGRDFDPANRATFRLHQHRRLTRWLSSPMGWPPVILSLAAAAGVLLVSRWKWGAFTPSLVDLRYYLKPSSLLHRTNLLTPPDYVFALSMLAAIAVAAWWIIRDLAAALARWRMGSHPDDRPMQTGRRHFLLALGLIAASAGALLGWPYRLAQQWIARRMAKGSLKAGPFIAPAPPVLSPTALSPTETAATLRAAVIEMPRAAERMTGLQLLLEDYPGFALPILTEAVPMESDSEVRATELRLIGLHRDFRTLDLLRGFLTHPDSQTRAAAADAVGLVHAPAFDIPLNNGNWNSPGLSTTAAIPISLGGFVQLQIGAMNIWPQHIRMDVKPTDAVVRLAMEKMMLTGPTSDEREAAARALVVWPPEDYHLRIAEWGVWINDGGELKLIQSVLDEIPPFVHRTGNPLREFSDRINQIMIVTKPIIHITVDRPMAIDVNVVINRGRPWFAYPLPDDFAVDVGTVYWQQANPPTPPLAPLDNPKLGNLTDIRQGYPWLTPHHPTAGPSGARGFAPSGNQITALGLRWQSVIASPTRPDWMTPPQVGPDPRFAWWNHLRDVPSSWLSSRGETERFLYYDGPTLQPTPVAVKLMRHELQMTLHKEANQLPMTFPTPESAHIPQSILLIRHAAGRLSAQSIQPPADWDPDHPTCTVPLRNDDLFDDQVIDHFRAMLTTAGLTPAESEGLIASWSTQFFHTDGTRLLLLMSRQDYDLFCPIQIRPAPTEMARVGIILTEFA